MRGGRFRVQKLRSVVIEDIRYADCSPLVPYKTKSNVEQPTKYPEPHKVRIVEQEAMKDVGDFSEPEAAKKGKGKTVADAPKKGKAARSSKDKEVAKPEAPEKVKATRKWLNLRHQRGLQGLHKVFKGSLRHQIGRGGSSSGDELRSVHSDEDDETVTRGKNSNTITMKQTNKTIEAVREYCLLSGKQVTFTRNEKYKLKAVCKAVSCPWQIYVAWKNPTDRSLVVKYYNPIIIVSEHLKTHKPQLTRAKIEALRIIEGTVAEHRKLQELWDLEEKNLGSTTKMHCEFVDGETVFKRLYICLEPLKRGFKMNYRPFIGLDACHLKGFYGGQLLTAIGIDPNNETWVLAYAVVEMETRESWTWFIDLLAKDVDINNLCESFNNSIKTTRDKAIITMLEMISGLVVLNIKWMQEEVTNMWWIWIITLVLAESGSCQAFLVLMELLPYITNELWEKTNQTAIKPLAYTRQPGRPRNVRIIGAEERIDKTGKKWLGRQGVVFVAQLAITKPLTIGIYLKRKNHYQGDEAKAVARVRRKLAYARVKAAPAAKKAALNASKPNAAETARIGLRASKRQRT
ncbi:hypothetical protein Prudu_013469 [Prunus dulcis]|uniref:MULE transposase domain-containing protein n=1 Tax=Prunus dulcis TaxID=3755 RepID=A0A4Y1REV5_PRUDU|nr:hypothetical protein Prudu_013469 [Prunus dulcis]